MLSFQSPTHWTVVAERARYEHKASLDYVAHVRRSTLYDTDTIGRGEPLYTRLTRGVEVTFRGTARLEGVGEVAGEYAVRLVLGAPESWTKRLELVLSSRARSAPLFPSAYGRAGPRLLPAHALRSSSHAT